MIEDNDVIDFILDALQHSKDAGALATSNLEIFFTPSQIFISRECTFLGLPGKPKPWSTCKATCRGAF